MMIRSHVSARKGVASRSRYVVCALLSAFGMAGFGAGCGAVRGDAPNGDAGASVLGADDRLRDVLDPASPKHPKIKPGESANVRVSGVAIVHVDTFDETRDGKSRGTVYVQDLSSKLPYSGTSLFAASYVPADLRVAGGDVLDFAGQYTELASIGAAVFPPGDVLIQLARPTGTFRYEVGPQEPTDIDINDLTTFANGRKWLGMLVRVRDLTIPVAPFESKGRLTVAVAGDVRNSRSNPAQISNELYDLQAADIALGKKFKSVVGVVTYFYAFKIAPRSAADLEVAQ
jgi:hypothetical protein